MTHITSQDQISPEHLLGCSLFAWKRITTLLTRVKRRPLCCPRGVYLLLTHHPHHQRIPDTWISSEYMDTSLTKTASS